MKTAEFGQPCRAPEHGRCRICGCTRITACSVETTCGNRSPITGECILGCPGSGACRQGKDGGSRACGWTDETQTLCDAPTCVDAARAELTTDPAEADLLRRPYEGKRYGFAPGRER